MAKIHEEIIIVKISKLVRDDDSTGKLATAELVEALQTVAQELAGSGTIVEVEHA
jgi:hypothetical protein